MIGREHGHRCEGRTAKRPGRPPLLPAACAAAALALALLGPASAQDERACDPDGIICLSPGGGTIEAGEVSWRVEVTDSFFADIGKLTFWWQFQDYSDRQEFPAGSGASHEVVIRLEQPGPGMVGAWLELPTGEVYMVDVEVTVVAPTASPAPTRTAVLTLTPSPRPTANSIPTPTAEDEIPATSPPSEGPWAALPISRAPLFWACAALLFFCILPMALVGSLIGIPIGLRAIGRPIDAWLRPLRYKRPAPPAPAAVQAPQPPVLGPSPEPESRAADVTRVGEGARRPEGGAADARLEKQAGEVRELVRMAEEELEHGSPPTLPAEIADELDGEGREVVQQWRALVGVVADKRADCQRALDEAGQAAMPDAREAAANRLARTHSELSMALTEFRKYAGLGKDAVSKARGRQRYRQEQVKEIEEQLRDQEEVPHVSTRGHFLQADPWYRPARRDPSLVKGQTGISYELRGPIPGTGGLPCAEELVVIVHGYDNSPDTALSNFCKARASLRQNGYAGAVIGYSWDSDTRTGAFGFDDAKANAVRNGPKLARFLLDLKSRCPDTIVRIVAHSMGSRVTLEAILDLASRQPAPGWRIDSVHLLGAAVDNEEVQTDARYGAAIEAAVGNLYNYYNREDDILSNLYMSQEADQALGENDIEDPDKAPANYASRDVQPLISDDTGGTGEADEWNAGDDHSGYFGVLGPDGKLVHDGAMSRVVQDFK